MLKTRPLILFIDAYDSFSNNIISLLETGLDCSVRTIRIDHPVLLASEAALLEELRNYDAVVCGPGPGHPGNPKDVGIINKIWKLRDNDLLPVLGICLGFQSLCLEFGAEVKRLKGPQHGIIRSVTHVGQDTAYGKGTIFEGLDDLKAVHYQSLHADIGQDEAKVGLQHTSKWKATTKCPELVPLAYVESDLSVDNDSGVRDAMVLVAVRHIRKPFWALQYHPESICTEPQCHKVIKNWFKVALQWNVSQRRQQIPYPRFGDSAVRESLLNRTGSVGTTLDLLESKCEGKDVCHTKVVPFLDHISVTEVLEAIQDLEQGHILLESTNAYEKFSIKTDVRGRYSIMALDVDIASRFEYTVGSKFVTVFSDSYQRQIRLEAYGDDVWVFLAKLLEERKVDEGDSRSPFWGGFMGYTTYELGLESIEVSSQESGAISSRPDLCFAWITRSLVIDHVNNNIYIQYLAPGKHQSEVHEWFESISQALERLLATTNSRTPSPSRSSCLESSMRSIDDTPASTPPRSLSPLPTQAKTPSKVTSKMIAKPRIETPSDNAYESKVTQCQEFISNGDSYELCLTDQTTITRRMPTCSKSSWDLYRSLRARQPAPFASYVRLGGTTIVSSSPERFLCWDENNFCSLRPMKGTVRKTEAVDTLEKARKLLEVPKEKAENLMIVDLVRHDLHGVCGSGNVQVPRLCVVEEYKSVFQMISVVEGHFPMPSPGSGSRRHTGLDVLAASLPPGSMTGAPKKRSCEILQQIEDQKRGLYSGVIGYLDVRGRGDWSVTIRSLFKWDDEDTSQEILSIDGVSTPVEFEKWHIGAGGAVTTLSTAVGEREEMQTKLKGTLGLFI